MSFCRSSSSFSSPSWDESWAGTRAPSYLPVHPSASPVTSQCHQSPPSAPSAHLSQLLHHVREDVQEADDGVPEAAVGQALLVPSTGALGDTGILGGTPESPQGTGDTYWEHWGGLWAFGGLTWMYSVRLLNTCLATAMALEKFLLPCSSMTSLPE